MPLPKPPTQKNGIGRYRRVSASMHRAARPDCTARSALPCEWMTPFGGPLLPDVNMMTRLSAAVTVAVIASTVPVVAAVACGNWSGVQTARSAGSSVGEWHSDSSSSR